MVSAAILGTIATIFSIAGTANNVANITNISYDNQVVQESLQQMKDTHQKLLTKAKQETDPTLREQKMLVAQKLGETHTDLSKMQSELVVKAARKETAGIVKGLLVGKSGEIAQAGKVIKNLGSVVDGGVDNAIALKEAVSNSKIDDSTMWSQAARSSEGLDAEILKVKARQRLNDTKDLNNDLQAWINQLEEQEKAEQIDSEEFEKKLGEKISEEPELQEVALGGVLEQLDIDLSEETEEEQTNEIGIPKSGSIVGYWGVNGEWSYHYKADGTVEHKDGAYGTFTNGTVTGTYEMGEDGYGNIGTANLCIILDGDQLYMSLKRDCSQVKKPMYIFERIRN